VIRAKGIFKDIFPGFVKIKILRGSSSLATHPNKIEF
jgi:hypothetical protein